MSNTKLQKISRHAGFTLIEVVVVMGLMGIGTLAVLSTTDLINKVQVGARSLGDFNSATSYLTSVVQTDSSCNFALQAKNTPPVNPAFTPTINPTPNNNPAPIPISVYDQAGNVLLKAGMPFGSIQILGMNLLVDPNQPAAGPLRARLELTASKKTGSMGVKTMSYTNAWVTLAIDGAKKLQSCNGLRLGNGSTLNLPACAPDQTLYSPDGTSVTCKTFNVPSNTVGAADGAACSPEGYMVRDINGGYICNSATWMQMPSKLAAKCSAFNGTVYTSGTTSFCRIPSNGCPTGMTQLNSWSTTTKRNNVCGGSTTGCTNGACCSTGKHSWSDTATETCWAGRHVACGPAYSGGTNYSANITEIGCH